MINIRALFQNGLLLGALLAGLLGLPASSVAQAEPVYTGRVSSSQPLQSAQQILDRLKASNRLPAELAPKISVVNNSQLNAATDGKSIIVTSALWNALGTNDQRAFVIGHELSHVALNHIGKTQVRRVGLAAVDQLVLNRYSPQGSLTNALGSLGLNLVDKRFSRTVEYQADDLGFQMVRRAGYDPAAALAVFRVLQANSGKGGLEFLQDHPLSESRIRQLSQKYQLHR